MPTKERKIYLTDYGSNKDRSMHLIQCTGTGPDVKDCVAWTSI